MEKDISITLSSFLMKAAGLWVVSNTAEQRRRWLALTYTLGILSFGVYINLNDLLNVLGDISNVLYDICNLTFIFVGLIKLFVLSLKKTKFVKLVLYTQSNFWHSNYDPKEKILLAECRRFCTFFIVFGYCILGASLANYILTPLIIDYGRNVTDRSLPFAMWVDLPLSVSPYYEITFATQILSVTQIGVCHICFDNFLCMINFHMACQFRILQYRLSSLWESSDDDGNLTDYVNKCNASLRKCIRQHQSLIYYCKKVNDLYSLNVLAFVLAFSLVICLTMYQVLMVEAAFTKRLIFIFLTFGSCVELVLFMYSCDIVIRESENVAVTIYSGRWTNLPANTIGLSMRNNINIIILRANRPCFISAGGFSPMSLETATAVLSTAMSYFTLLTNSTESNE